MKEKKRFVFQRRKREKRGHRAAALTDKGNKEN